jgi:hypothetical protein
MDAAARGDGLTELDEMVAFLDELLLNQLRTAE